MDLGEIRGFWLVRVHRRPRTTLFSPKQCADNDQPPMPMNPIVYRKTNTDIIVAGMKCIEDAWSGNESDAKTLRTTNGKPILWTGETGFHRVMLIEPLSQTRGLGNLRKNHQIRPIDCVHCLFENDLDF